jgi:hypothetical protein
MQLANYPNGEGCAKDEDPAAVRLTTSRLEYRRNACHANAGAEVKAYFTAVRPLPVATWP